MVCRRFPEIIAINLLGLLIVFLIPLMVGKPVMTGLWSQIPIPIAGKLSSVLAFDLYIYILVAVCTTRAYIEFTNFSQKGSEK